MKLSTLLLGSLISVVSAIPVYDLEPYDLEPLLESSDNYTLSDKVLINEFSKELALIDKYNGTDSTKCDKCVKRLELGKAIALMKPKLVYPVFTKWCIDNDVDTVDNCKTEYGRNTVDNSTYGTNFANMLYLMEPASYDGKLYCHYQDSKSCSLPETPKIDMSSYWPKKEAKHYVAPTVGNETYQVLHISDFHIELNYEIGAETNCTRGMCCTPFSENKYPVPEGYNFTVNMTEAEIGNLSYTPAWYDIDDELQYGKPVDVFSNQSVWYPANTFGHYECDSPPVLVNSSLKSVAEYQEKLGLDFKFSIFTGDMVDHEEAKHLPFEEVVESEEIILRDLKKLLKNIPVYSVLGNHDTFPYGQIAPEKSGFSNLFDWNAELLAEMWEDFGWIDSDVANYTSHHYAGFAVTTTTNLKIIVMNSNVYYYKNLYAYCNASDPDPFGQFQFVIDELIASEAKNERVWIMAHIPFVEEALPVPAEVFQQIVKRFAPYTIAEIFFGHTHMDQWNLLYDGDVTNKTEETLVANAWISHAVTPLTENNPAWRYYTIDTKTHNVMDSFNYYTKLNDTFFNDNGEPVWEFEYSARDAYSEIAEWPATAPLNATFWHRIATAVNTTDEVAQTYNNYKRRFSPYVPDCIGTDDCNGSWCFLASFTLADYTECMKVFDEPEFW